MLFLQQEAASSPQDPGLLDQALERARDYAPAILGALLTLLIGRWLAKLGTGVLRRVLNARRVDVTLTGFLCNLAYFAALTLVIIASVGKLGVETALAESTVDLFCRPWVRSADHAAVSADLLERIKLAFEEQGISIPCPQRDVHLFQASA